MRKLLVRRLVPSLVASAVLLGCGDDDGTPAGARQPVAGLVVATGEGSGEVTLAGVLDDAPPPVGWTVPVRGPATGAVAPSLDPISPTRLRPFERLTLTGTGFRPADSAMSVLFVSARGTPVAVPVMSATATTLEVVVPHLPTPDAVAAGADVDVRVLQAGAWGRAASESEAGVSIAPLPTLSGTGPDGRIVEAWLGVGLTQIDAALASPLDPGAGAEARLQELAAQLGALRTAVAQIRDNPAQLASIPSADGTPFVIDAATLAHADTLAGGVLFATAEALSFATEAPLPDGFVTRASALSTCVPNTGDPWVDDFLCQRQHYGETLASRGAAGVALGAQIELGVFLGFWGSSAATLAATQGERVRLAVQVVWAGLSGHIATWATASPRPDAPQTLVDMGAELLDDVAGTRGVLPVLVSGLGAAGAVDRLMNPPPPRPPNPGARVLEGTFEKAGGTPAGWECPADLYLTLVFTIPELEGAGTAASPWSGALEVIGSIRAVEFGGEDCEVSDSTIPLNRFEGTVSGSAGVLEIEGEIPIGAGTIPFVWSGVPDGTSFRGPLSITVFSGDGFEASRPFEGELVLEEP